METLQCWAGAAISRPAQRAGRGAGWEPRRGTLAAATAPHAARELRRGSRAGGRVGARCLAQRPRRGGNVQPRRGIAWTLHVKPKGWAVETYSHDQAFAPKARLSCVDRLNVIRSGILPCALHER